MAQTLGSVAVGSIVKLNESGSPVEYLVVQQGKPGSMYDDSCDGTWLLRKDIAEKRAWNSLNNNVLEDSSLRSYLNSSWPNRYDTDIQNAIKQVKVPYRQGGGAHGTDQTGSNGLSCKVFLLSGFELGWAYRDNQYFPSDGDRLAYFLDGTGSAANQKRVATLNGSATVWWTRSPVTNSTDLVWRVLSDGDYHYNHSVNFTYGVRPALIFPADLLVLDDGTVSTAPPSPATLTVPSIVMQGQGIPVSWSQADGADGYILERKADSGAWTQVYSGANLSYADTAGSWSTVQYRVKAGVDGTYGDYTTSAAVPVLAASALAISGTDGSLGTVTADIPYTVSTDTGSQISLVQTVNGAQMYSGQVTSGAARSIPVMELPSGNGTIVLTATVQTGSGPVSAARTWTYNKTPISFPASGGVAQLTKSGANLLPKTLAEAVRTNPFWGGSLDKALDKLTRAVTYATGGEQVPRYQEVTVNLSAAQEGDIVQLPEGVKLVEFYVAKLNYEQALNGAGRTLLVRKDIWGRNTWGLDTSGTYDGSDIDIRLNGTYKNSLGSDVQAAMGTTTFYCTENAVSDEVIPLSKAVFALSLTELGWNAATANVEGSELPIAGTLQIAMYEGDAIGQWTRSPDITDTGRANLVTPQGKASTQRNETTFGYRPCFTLPSTFTATYYVDGNGALHDAQEYDQAGDFYDLLGNVVPSVKIATGSYVGTGTAGKSGPNTLTFPFEPKMVVITAKNPNNGTAILGPTAGFSYLTIASVNNTFYMAVTVDQTSISWYTGLETSDGSYRQMNNEYNTYSYVAIG